MATRLYFNESRNAAIDIGVAVGSQWEENIGAGVWPTKRAQTSTDGNSNVSHLTSTLGTGTNPTDVLFGQFLTDTLPSGVIISGTVVGVMCCREGSLTDNLFTQLGLYVVDSAGALVATLLNGVNTGGTEYNNPSANTRALPRGGSVAISSYTTVNATSRICIEIGTRTESTKTAATGYMYFGGGTGGDLPSGDGSSNSLTLSPWIEFSADIFTPPAGGGARSQAVMFG